MPALFSFIAMTFEQLTSAIQSNILAGLKGVTANQPFTLEQIADEIIQERLQIIKEYSMKNLIPLKDLMYSISCLDVDCKDIDKCSCPGTTEANTRHIEIPQLYNDFGQESVEYLGATDRLLPYKVYTDSSFRQHQYKRRGKDTPFVWIDTTPNSNGMNDAFIFNAPPTLQRLRITFIPKDIRQLDYYDCCASEGVTNLSFIDTEIEKRVSEKLIRYYRLMGTPILPNDQTVKP